MNGAVASSVPLDAIVMALILLLSAITMGSRFLGFFAVREARGKIGRALHYLPYGMFAAIVAAGAPAEGGEAWIPRLAAGFVTALTARREWPIILSIASGFFTAWIFRRLI